MSELLFDISPDEPEGRKKSRSRPPAAAPAEESAAEPAFAAPRVLDAVLGTIDDKYVCGDESCAASAHDIIDVCGRYWYVECVFCGTCQWEDAIPGFLDAAGEEFRFRDGRFSGKTLEEVSRLEHGLQYIEFSAQKHEHDDVREACRSWLDHSRPSS